MNISIYDPPLCCSSGLCGPAPDPVLIKVNDAIIALKKQGVEVARYNLAQQPQAYADNRSVSDLLHRNGKKILPIVLANGEIVKTGAYPEYEELCNALGIQPLKHRPVSLTVIDREKCE